MEITQLTREFRYNGVKLADPSPAFTLQQVRDFYANVYPEIVNADIEGPENVGTSTIYTFKRAVGTKGSRPLTRAAAIEQLRTHGQLGGHRAPDRELPGTALQCDLTRAVVAAVVRQQAGTRMLAPSHCHAVLP